MRPPGKRQPTRKGWTGVSAGEPRWRWDLNPRWSYPHTRFRVLRTRVQPRSSASVSCSASPSTAIAEPSRTTTNETTTETMREGSHGLLTAGSRALTQAGSCGHPSRAAAAADVHPISHERALGLAHRSPLPLRYFGGGTVGKSSGLGRLRRPSRRALVGMTEARKAGPRQGRRS
jgi:hypothetical protein